jgi:hypothetical protein
MHSILEPMSHFQNPSTKSALVLNIIGNYVKFKARFVFQSVVNDQTNKYRHRY